MSWTGTAWHGMACDGMEWHGMAWQGTAGHTWHTWHRMACMAQDDTGWHRLAHMAHSTGWHTEYRLAQGGTHSIQHRMAYMAHMAPSRGWQRMAHTAHSTARHTEDAPSSRAPSPLRTAGRRAGQSASNCCRMGPGGSRGGADPQWIGSTIAASPGRRPQRRRGPQSQTWGARRGGTQQYGGGRRVSLPPRPPPGTPGAPTHMTAHCAKDR